MKKNKIELENKMLKFFYPTAEITIEAPSKEEADKIVKDILQNNQK